MMRQHMHSAVASDSCFIFSAEHESRGLCLQLAKYEFKNLADENFCILP